MPGLTALDRQMAVLLHRTNRRHRQQGAATLLMTLGLLLSMSLTLLYLNRSLMFAQKAAANQFRTTLALEMAEAGLEWATGMLNTARHIDASCAFSTSATTSFRRQYVQTAWNTGTAWATEVAPATTSYPGCKIDGNNWTCSCPVPSGSGANTATLGSALLPGFSIAFFATGDPEAVRIVSSGCTAQTGTCSPTNAGASDASATVSAVLKLRRLPRAQAAAALTCGTTCTVGDTYTIVNQDQASAGLLVNAGGAIDLSAGASFTSIPGQPGVNAILGNDTSLSAISETDPTCSQSALFSSFFGATLAQYARSPMVRTIVNCAWASSCGALVDAAYAEGWRSFYFPDGFARDSSSPNLGSATDPVTLVSTAVFNLIGNGTVYGMVFSNHSIAPEFQTGSATIQGALLTCAGFNTSGNGRLAYDASILQALQRSTSPLVRVPGSWTDRCRASRDHPPSISCS
jgi:Tfp pilus assembly protein PilX